MVHGPGPSHGPGLVMMWRAGGTDAYASERAVL